MSTLVLGISDLAIDPSVAAMDATGPIAAVEETKLNRLLATGMSFPRMGVEYCLRQAAATMADVDVVAVARRPRQAWLRERRLHSHLLGCAGAARYTQGAPAPRNLSALNSLRRELGSKTPVRVFEHHLCHAASTYYASEFDRALVLTLDGSGDMWSGMLALGEGTDLRMIRSLRFPDSLGWLYTQVTGFLGFRPFHEEQKTQWLSAQGEPAFQGIFQRLFPRRAGGLPVLDRRFLSRPSDGEWRLSNTFYDQFRLRSNRQPTRAERATIARSVQGFLEDTVVDIAEQYRLSTNTRYLCLAGGVFLNVLLVRALEQRTGFADVFVQPASNNAGTALGAAYLARQHVNGGCGRQPMSHVHLGPEFDAAQIKAVLDNCKVVYRYLHRERELLAETTALLRQNLTVAWYQGRTEFGLRALGNRTILASPFSPYVTENLNQYIKHREDFHPFVLSVPAERAPEWFEFGGNCRFAASVGRVRPGVTGFERFMFGDRLVRLHVVDRTVNPRFGALLDKFGETAAAPVLVNTSFNLFGEPLVVDPRAAMRSFYCAGIDALVIGDFIVVK